MKDLKGKVALITGAANGFGREYVKQAAMRGMKIVAADIEGDEVLAVEPLARELGAEDIICVQADVSLYEDTQKLVKAAMENPIDSPKLSELAKGKPDCTIIISDHTRPVPSMDILPVMIEEIRKIREG